MLLHPDLDGTVSSLHKLTIFTLVIALYSSKGLSTNYLGGGGHLNLSYGSLFVDPLQNYWYFL